MYNNPIAELPARVRLRLVRDGDPPKKTVVDAPAKVYDLVGSYLRELARESLLAIYLDNRNQLLGVDEISTGTSLQTLVSPNEILKSALLISASGIILVHNHPSGIATPSEEDRQTTRVVKQALELLSITLLDHIIIAADSYHSILNA